MDAVGSEDLGQACDSPVLDCAAAWKGMPKGMFVHHLISVTPEKSFSSS